VFAFGLNAYFILFGESLFTRANERAYFENLTKVKPNDFHETFLQQIINMCLDSDPTKRPTFDFLNMEVFQQCIFILLRQGTEKATMQAVELIKASATKSMLDYQNEDYGYTCLFHACAM
jgi:hypothetical protein